MAILVTGAAGFIGFYLSKALADRGEHVLGVDSLTDYYDASLKTARLAELAGYSNFTFVNADIADRIALERAIRGVDIDRIVHLAAQAGVRYSLDNPRAYVRSNVAGHLEILELARHLPGFKHLVYASSSSVYGDNDSTPFAETDRVDEPRSLYAATKRADELMSLSYAKLFGIAQTGLRFFTVYGPWGRPDMAYWTFSEAILQGRPVRLFGYGEALRDFTYIDDIITGTVAALDRPIDAGITPPHRIYNLGNNRPVSVLRFLDVLESLLGRKAERILEPLPPGDVPVTCANIEAAARDLGFGPRVDLETGLGRFVEWYLPYRNQVRQSAAG